MKNFAIRFMRLFHILLDEGFSYKEVLMIMEKEFAETAPLRKTCKTIYTEIESGKYLYQGINKCTEVFPHPITKLLQYAEMNGAVDRMFLNLSVYLEEGLLDLYTDKEERMKSIISDLKNFICLFKLFIEIGVVAEEAFSEITATIVNENFKNCLNKMAAAAKELKSIHPIMEEHPAFFSPAFVAIIKKAEATGSFSISLENIMDGMSYGIFLSKPEL